MPHIDPHYIIDQLLLRQERQNDPSLLGELFECESHSRPSGPTDPALAVFATNDCPLLETRLAQEHREERREKLMDVKRFRVQAYLDCVPDPLRAYNTTDGAVTDLYKHHVEVTVPSLAWQW